MGIYERDYMRRPIFGSPPGRFAVLAIGAILLVLLVAIVAQRSPPSTPPAAADHPPRLALPLDPNTATLDELQALPGLGPVRAQAILDHRPYATVDDLTKAPGIGPVTLDRLRPYLHILSVAPIDADH